MSEQRIIVTGAASGIGRACARTLLASGHKVAALDIAEEALKREFEGQPSAVTIALDAGSPESCKAAIDQAAARLGGLNAFVHFAALWTGMGWEQSDTAEWDRLLSVNLRGSFLLAQAAIPHLRAAGGGSLVLTALDSARVGGVSGGEGHAASTRGG